MREYPSDFDVNDFVGLALSSIMYTTTTIRIGFENGYAINTELDVLLLHDQQATEIPIPAIRANANELLGQQVTTARIGADASLSLQFERGAIVEFRVDEAPYESFEVSGPGFVFAI